MKNSILIKTVLIAAALPLIAGCVEREVVYRQSSPPPPQAEVVPVAPGPLAVWFWVPGCWEWRGHWVWFGGHWAARPHPGAVWIDPHWGHRGHRRVWIEGHWR